MPNFLKCDSSPQDNAPSTSILVSLRERILTTKIHKISPIVVKGLFFVICTKQSFKLLPDDHAQINVVIRRCSKPWYIKKWWVTVNDDDNDDGSNGYFQQDVLQKYALCLTGHDFIGAPWARCVFLALQLGFLVTEQQTGPACAVIRRARWQLCELTFGDCVSPDPQCPLLTFAATLTSAHSLLSTGQDPRCVNDADALQDLVGHLGTLKPGSRISRQWKSHVNDNQTEVQSGESFRGGGAESGSCENG